MVFIWVQWVQWVQLRWEMIVRFDDIGGIDDHHCLNFLFKLFQLKMKKKKIWWCNTEPGLRKLCLTFFCRKKKVILQLKLLLKYSTLTVWNVSMASPLFQSTTIWKYWYINQEISNHANFFILQSLHLLYNKQIQINVCFICLVDKITISW